MEDKGKVVRACEVSDLTVYDNSDKNLTSKLRELEEKITGNYCALHVRGSYAILIFICIALHVKKHSKEFFLQTMHA